MPPLRVSDPTAWNRVPAALRKPLEAALTSDEAVVAWFEPDLDLDFRYGHGLVVLTGQRLLTVASGQPVPEAWALEDGLTFRTRDAGGLGILEWGGPQGRLAAWHYTLAHRRDAAQFVAHFHTYRLAESTQGAETTGMSSPPATPPGDTIGGWTIPAGSLFRLWRFARPHLRWVTLGVLLTFVSTAAGLIPPYLTIPLMDQALIPMQNAVRDGQPPNMTPVYYFLAALAGSALLAWLLSWARIYVLSWVSELVAAELRTQTYAHLQRLSVDFFGSKRTGDLISRVGSDTDRICIFLSVNLLDFCTDSLMILMTAGILFTIDPVLALVTLGPFPIIGWLVQRIRKRLRAGFDRSSRAWAEMVSVLADTIPGIRVVKAFAQEHREIERFRRGNDLVVWANDMVNRIWSFFGPMLTLLTEIGLIVVWGCGAWRISAGHITVGVLAAFLTYISRFFTRLESMSRMVASVQRAGAATDRIFEVLDCVPSVPEPVKAVHLGRVKGLIEFRNVSFSYGNRQVLHDINLVIEPGEMIGLVGPSGAGKSTFINLMCRFYDVQSGAILLDGVDLRSYPVEEYRKQLGLVLQEPFLFYGTVAENIAYGMPHAKTERIVASARAAHAHEFILRLAEGYDSLVGERGQSLSGGERQRVSIARALLIDPRILILDEATSSVDTETERVIQTALENLILGRTTLAIAHRLSTLRRANRLVVLEQGRIAEVGSHETLLRQGGTYHRLYQAQRELAENITI